MQNEVTVRKIQKRYDDPVNLIWRHAARQMGMQIERSSEVNASWNGEGVLTIGTPDSLDADDCLAQMILHEACHALCEGPESLRLPDWGLESFDPSKKVHEHACLRLQAAFADRYGMRTFFAATTIFRKYYNQLPADPLAAGDDPAIDMARKAWNQATVGPWAQPIYDALRRTAIVLNALNGITDEYSLWHVPLSPVNGNLKEH